jgi:hypothetical protein
MSRTRWAVRARRAGLIAVHVLTVVLIVSVPAAAFAAPVHPALAATKTLSEVITGLQGWIRGILFAVATLYLMIGGFYRATAGGDPSQVEKSNTAFKNALIGYGLAILAPAFMDALKPIVGG